MLHATAIAVRVGGKALLDGVSLSVGHGEAVALVGPNGAGKSTLLRVLSGELKPSAGLVTLKRHPLGSYRPASLALHRAVMSQNITCAFPFRAVDIVRMGAGDARGVKVEALVARALADVDLADFGDRVITTLSGGEQQRVHFARVLVQLACGEAKHGPGVLLLDEPTANLDLRHQLDLLTATRCCTLRGNAVVAILHDLNLATLFAERIVMLDHGRIAADGSASETVTEAMLAQTFRVEATVGRTSSGVPFVLPHDMKKRLES